VLSGISQAVSHRLLLYFIFLRLIPYYICRIVARFVSHIPSHVRQTMEFIRPIVEERSAKMKEFGENWDDAPVRQPILFEFDFI
jgi:hypothetical protein